MNAVPNEPANPSSSAPIGQPSGPDAGARRAWEFALWLTVLGVMILVVSELYLGFRIP